MDRSISVNRIARLFGLVLLLALIFTAAGSSVSAKADESIRLNVTEAAIAKDGVFRLRIYNVPKNSRITYRSSDTSVAYVDSRGYITGISNGECVITATVIVGDTPTDTLKCTVTVGPAAISIKLTKSELVLSVGMKKTLKTIISPLNTVEKPVFYSSDKGVASVTSIGRVRAKGTGEASVFAFLLNGESAECQVYVLDDEDYEKYLESGSLVGIIEGYSESGDENQKENNESGNEGQEGEKVTGEPSENKTGLNGESEGETGKEPTPTVSEIENN